MNDLAHEGTEHPALQRVDCGLERHAEDNEEEIGYAEVENEKIGGVISDLPASEQHSENQAVPDGSQKKDEREDH